MKPFFILALGVLLVSCSDEQSTESTASTSPGGVDITAPDSITKTFTLPDSINSTLIIATYVEIDPESHTVLMYDKADKKSALHIRYLNDGNVLTEKLDVVSDTLLKTKVGNEFIINDSTVIFKLTNGHPQEHYRTDAN